MHEGRLVLCPVSLAAGLTWVGGPAALAGGQLPGTLNFQDVTASRIVQTVSELTSNEKEVEFGDFDNDDDLDVVIAVGNSDFGQRRNKLYRNDDGVFFEISGSPAIPEFSGTDVSRNAFFRDYDGDGWLDIIVVNNNNTAGDAGRTKLYLNRQVDGTFSHFEEVGLTHLGFSAGGAADGAVSIDADLDDDFDLYVGNDPGPSQDSMYFNDGQGFFESVTGTHVPPDADYTDDVAAGDMNGDGKLDLLITNGLPDNFIYYNDNGPGSSGPGDFQYGPDGLGARQSLGTAGSESAMEPGDFDNDGKIDIYWSNRSGLYVDRVLRNAGNDAGNKAILVELPESTLPPSVTERLSFKATVADLNDDGRLDVVVMSKLLADSRPTVLRNTTVNGEISFVDWTPGDTFPGGSVHEGAHAAVFDTNGDGDLDIFLGGNDGDHLFENVPAVEVTEDALPDGQLPDLFNLDPVAVVGGGSVIEADSYTVSGIGAGSFISVVLNGPDDYRLEVLDAGLTVLASSDRGGLGIEEALQAAISSAGTYTVRVTVLASAGSMFDLDGSGVVNVVDLIQLLLCFGQPASPGCKTEDINGDGTVNVLDLIGLLLNWGPVVNEYVLEVLARG